MKTLGGYERKKDIKATEGSGRGGRRRAKNEEAVSSSFKIGRSFGGDVEREREQRLSRIALRKKRSRRKYAVLSVVGLLVLVALFWGLSAAIRYKRDIEATHMPEEVQTEPTVQIVDESAGNNLSQRVKQFIIQLENDVKDYDLVINHVVLPLQKSHQIYVYIEGRDEYYKISVDRGSGVQAEDISRMIKYLDNNDIHCAYVDLRVEGKAYYK